MKNKTFVINKKTNYVGSYTLTFKEQRAATKGKVSRINVFHAKTGVKLTTITNIKTAASSAKRIPIRDKNTNEFIGMSSYFVVRY